MQASAETIWNAAQEHLRSMLSADIYNLWFAPLRACGQDQEGIILEVANDFCEVWLKDNYMGLLQDVVALASGHQLRVKFKVASSAPIAVASTPPAPAPVPAKPVEQPVLERTVVNQELSFNPKNTFETFVVGNNNNFAYAAAQAVAQSPGKSY
ncbi:MAG TPA: DnaA N-terminal domain-containing protein, partial [Clostridia bacterium]|nr:DnaA N-terminal domain-containing protein [Clostridia bacterium]